MNESTAVGRGLNRIADYNRTAYRLERRAADERTRAALDGYFGGDARPARDRAAFADRTANELRRRADRTRAVLRRRYGANV